MHPGYTTVPEKSRTCTGNNPITIHQHCRPKKSHPDLCKPLQCHFCMTVQKLPCFESAQKLITFVNEARGIKGKVSTNDWVTLTKFANDLQRPALKSRSGQALAMIVDFGPIAKLAGNKIPDSNHKDKESVIS